MEIHAKRFWGTLLLAVMLLMLVPAGFAAANSVAVPTADVKPGLYREAKTVSLSTETPGAKIYYSLDNKMPDENSTEYTGPITVDQTTNICAVAVADGVKSAPVTLTYLIKGSEEPILQFVAMSDIHIGDKTKDAPRVKKAFDVIQSIFPKPDAIVHAGDQINDNSHIGQPTRKADHKIVVDLLTQERADHDMTATEICMTTGNHDAGAAAMQEYYPEEWFPKTGPGYYHKQIGGYDFLFMNTEIYGDTTASNTQRAWLREKLLEVTNNKTEMNKPIFVVLHKPIANTVMGGQQASISSYNEDLKDYPQVVTFAGHSHLDVNDERAIHQNNFTSINTGSMSYIEIDRIGALMHTDEGTKVNYTIPVTQCEFIEVFADRVEIDRVAINADEGDAKTNGYIPAEPYHNTGVSVGERWTIDMTDDIKSKFEYTAEKRKGTAPTFAGDASVTATMNGSTAQVTFSQVEDVQKIHHYEINLVNEAGEDIKQIKVLPEHYFSPVPRTLTYDFADIPQFGGTYNFSVVGVDSFGNKSDPLVTTETITAPKLPGILPTYLVNETFTTMPTDTDTHAVPYVNCYGTPRGNAISEVKEGTLALVNQGTNGNFGMIMPLMPGSGNPETADGRAVTPLGEVIVEFEWKKGEQESQYVQAYFRGAIEKPDGTIDRKNLFCIQGSNGTSAFNKVNASNSQVTWQKGANYSNTTMTPVRIKFLNTEDGSFVTGIWQNGKAVFQGKEKLLVNAGTGFSEVVFSPKTGGTKPGDISCYVDNFKVWVPAAYLAEKLAAEEGGKVTFDDIKNENIATDNILTDLDLTTKKTTENNLQIVGWKSSNENVIATDGTVTRPGIGESDAEVTLTPIMGVLDFENEAEGDYATADGTPIKVTVKTTDIGGGLLPEEVNGVGYYVNEQYDETPTDPQTQSIPTVTSWVEPKTGDWSVADGKLSLIRKGGDSGFELDVPLMPGHWYDSDDTPLQASVPSGKVYVETEWQRGNKDTQTEIYFRSKNGNICVLQTSGSALKLDKVALNSSARSKYETSKDGLNFNSMNKARVLLDIKPDGTAYIEGYWVNGQVVKTGAEQIKSVGDGLQGLIFSRTGTGTDGYHIVDVNYVKTWQPVEDQLAAKAAAEEGKIAFTTIQGTNASADVVTADLNLAAGAETANGLTIIGWKSDKEDVVKPDGTVTRPAHGAGNQTVTLTPILGLRNSENETGVEQVVKTDGTPISITVLEQEEQVGPTKPEIKYLMTEEFDTLPTVADAATRPVPKASYWGQNAEASIASCLVNDSAVQLKLDQGLQSKIQMNIPLMPGMSPDDKNPQPTDVKPMPRGENMIEFEWKRHAKATQVQVYIQGTKGHTMKMDCNGTSLILYSSSNGSAFTSISTFKDLNFTSDCKIRLKIDTTGNTTVLKQLWVNGTPKLSADVSLFDAGDGLRQVMFAPGTGTTPVGEVVVSANYIKTWQSAASQLAPYVQAASADVTFNDIKGTNTGSSNITANLDFSSKTETANGLTIVKWISSKEAVIKPDGTVIRPPHEQGDEAVTLTPVFGLPDVTGEGENGYVTVNGTPINVTVKASEGSGPSVIGTEYYLNEGFDAAPSDGTKQPISTVVKQEGNDAKIVYQNGMLDYQFVRGAIKDGAEVKDGSALEIPLMPGNLDGTSPEAATVPRGEVYIESTWKVGPHASQMLMGLCGKNPNASGEARIFRFNCMGTGTMVYVDKYDPQDNRSTLVTLKDQKFGTEMQKVRFLVDTTGDKTILKKAWINGTEIPEAANQELMERGGLYKLRFASGGSSSALVEGDTIALVDSVKVWKPLVNTLQEKVAEAGAEVTFNDIKGNNSAADNVTTNLDFATKKLTDNGLTITGWKSSNTKVITASGAVTRYLEDTQVTLTPMLGVKDMEQETGSEYAAVEGKPITVTVKGDPENGASITDLQYLVNEQFDTLPAENEADTRPIPVPSFWGGAAASCAISGGAVQLKLDGGSQKSVQMNIPLMPGTPPHEEPEPVDAKPMPRGGNMIEFEWNRNSKSTQIAVYIKGANGHTMKLQCDGGTMSIQSSQDGTPTATKFTTIATVSNLDLATGFTKIRLKIDTSGDKTYLEQIWVNGSPKLNAKTELFGAGAGLEQVMFAPGNGSTAVGEAVCSVNYLKTWMSAASQIADVSKGMVTFSDIKGTNTAADQVKANLDFSKTDIKGFKVQGWKSSNEDVIAADGTVTRPKIMEEDVQVTLTPVLGIPDIENEGDGTYVYGDGAPVTVTVKKMQPAEAVAQVKANLTFDDIKGINAAADQVTDNLAFVRKIDGVEIGWSVQSMTPSTTTAEVDAATGMVVRPQMSESDATAVLRATLSCEGETDTKDITVTIKKLDVSTQEYLNQLKNALIFAEIAGGNNAPDQVTETLNLIPSFKGAKVTWQSSNTQTVKADGTVLRPDYPQPQVTLDLTATLSMEGAQPVSKVFHITVLPSDAENLAAGKAVKASVAADGDTKAAYLTDGDKTTTFRTKAGAKAYTATVDLGSVLPLSSVSVHEVANSEGIYAIEAYTIDVSNDGTTWKTVATGETIGENSKISFDPVLARYVRLNVTKKKSGVASELAELEVRLQPTDAQRVKADIAYLNLDLPDTVTANSITLPTKGVFGSEITWTFTPADLIDPSGTASGGEENSLVFTVNHPNNGQRVTMIATAKSGNATDKKNFSRNISGTSNGNGGGSSSGGGSGSGSSGSGGGKMPNLNLGNIGGGQTPGGGIDQPKQDGFRDMEQTQWAIPYVMKLYTHGVVQGDENGNFQPERSVNREEFVKMLVLALDIPTGEAQPAFEDTENGAWYNTYIQAAVAAGIVSGTAENRFGVGESISREDMATMVYRAMNYLQRNLEDSENAAAITDAQDISSYAQEAVSALVRGGIISGNDSGQFLPKNQSTRAEAAKMLAMLMQ